MRRSTCHNKLTNNTDILLVVIVRPLHLTCNNDIRIMQNNIHQISDVQIILKRLSKKVNNETK